MLKQLVKTLAIIALLIITNTTMAAPLAFAPVNEIPFSDVTDLNQNFTLSQFSFGDSLGVLSAVSATLDSSGQAHLAFLDRLNSQKIVLRYLRQKGVTWEGTVIDTVGKTRTESGIVIKDIPTHRPSIAVAGDGSVHLVYIKKSGKTAQICYSLIKNDNSLASQSVIDQVSDTSIHQVGLLIDSKKVVHVSYYKGGLKYAENSTGKFVASMVMADKTGNNFLEKGQVSEIIQLSDGTIMIPYMGTHHRNRIVVAQFVDCAINSKGKWKNSGITGELGVLSGDAIAAFVSPAGLPTAIYTHGGVLGYATYENNQWTRKNTGMGTTLSSGAMGATLAANGQEVVVWFNRDTALNLSTRKDSSASWSHSPVAKFRLGMLPQLHNPMICAMKDGKLDLYVTSSPPAKALVTRIVRK